MDIQGYSQIIWAVERAHHAFLDMVRRHLEREHIHDVNNIQAMMVFNLGDGELTVGEITRRGCYLGSNVSYNVKKLIEKDYLKQRRSEVDRRSVHVQLTEKGRRLRSHLTETFQEQAKLLGEEGTDNYEVTSQTLYQLDRFWDQAVSPRDHFSVRPFSDEPAPGGSRHGTPRSRA